MARKPLFPISPLLRFVAITDPPDVVQSQTLETKMGTSPVSIVAELALPRVEADGFVSSRQRDPVARTREGIGLHVEATFDPSDRDPHEVDRLFCLLTEEELSEFRNEGVSTRATRS